MLLSEGTLGIITEAELQVRNLPVSRHFLAARFEALESALDCARELCLAQKKPAVLRLYDPTDALAAGLRSSGRIPWLSEMLISSLYPLLLRRPGMLKKLSAD